MRITMRINVVTDIHVDACVCACVRVDVARISIEWLNDRLN